MAFSIEATMKGYRVLSVEGGVSKKGNPWKSVSVFRDGRTNEISVTDETLFAAVDNLREMGVYNFDVRAIAGRERSWISLLAAPLLVTAPDDDSLGF